MKTFWQAIRKWASVGPLSAPSLIHVVQHPDAAGHLRHAQGKFISGNREFDITHIVGNHQAGTCKVRDAETVPCYLSFGWIEVDSPNVVETTLPGKEIKSFSVGGPLRANLEAASPEMLSAAAIPVERSHAALLLLGGGDDQLWDCGASVERAAARLKRAADL